MTSEDLADALEIMKMPGAELARIVNKHAGTNMTAAEISKMKVGKRSPSALVRAVTSMLLEDYYMSDAKAGDIATALRAAGLRIVRGD